KKEYNRTLMTSNGDGSNAIKVSNTTSSQILNSLEPKSSFDFITPVSDDYSEEKRPYTPLSYQTFQNEFNNDASS
ncbi:24758_t:CDS:1, partial [Gigaspora rosea]